MATRYGVRYLEQGDFITIQMVEYSGASFHVVRSQVIPNPKKIRTGNQKPKKFGKSGKLGAPGPAGRKIPSPPTHKQRGRGFG